MAKSTIRFIPTKSNITGKNVRRLSGDAGTLTDTIYSACQATAYKTMQNAMYFAREFIAGAHDNGKMKFHDVTGNLYESIGLALIGKSPTTGGTFAQPSYPSNRSGFSATRDALGKGEAYDQDVYADGTKVVKRPYIGETDRGEGVRGREVRAQYLEKIKSANAPTHRHIYNLVAFAAMPYASYVNMKKNREYFQSVIMDSLRAGMQEAQMEAKLGK